MYFDKNLIFLDLNSRLREYDFIHHRDVKILNDVSHRYKRDTNTQHKKQDAIHELHIETLGR